MSSEPARKALVGILQLAKTLGAAWLGRATPRRGLHPVAATDTKGPWDERLSFQESPSRRCEM